jgi:hypothetical protein
VGKAVGPHIPTLDRKLLRTEGEIRYDLYQQFVDMNARWEAWKMKTSELAI